MGKHCTPDDVVDRLGRPPCSDAFATLGAKLWYPQRLERWTRPPEPLHLVRGLDRRGGSYARPHRSMGHLPRVRGMSGGQRRACGAMTELAFVRRFVWLSAR